jgi:hypothetical protein
MRFASQSLRFETWIVVASSVDEAGRKGPATVNLRSSEIVHLLDPTFMLFSFRKVVYIESCFSEGLWENGGELIEG